MKLRVCGLKRPAECGCQVLVAPEDQLNKADYQVTDSEYLCGRNISPKMTSNEIVEKCPYAHKRNIKGV